MQQTPYCSWAPFARLQMRDAASLYMSRPLHAIDATSRLIDGVPTQPKPGPPSRRLARSKSGAIVDESRAGVHDDLMRVPGKPLGFLAASTIEYHPARPEAHRSTVLAGQKLHSSRPPKPRELPVKVSLRHK